MSSISADQYCEEEGGETESETASDSEHDIGAEEESIDRFEEDEGLHTDISSGKAEETLPSVDRDDGGVLKVIKQAYNLCHNHQAQAQFVSWC